MDKYDSMTELYADPDNVEGTTYSKRWRRHQWSQLVEEQVTDNPETQTIVMAIHGGGVEPGTSYRVSLFETNTRPKRKNTTNDQFWRLIGALPKAMSKADVGLGESPVIASCDAC